MLISERKIRSIIVEEVEKAKDLEKIFSLAIEIFGETIQKAHEDGTEALGSLVSDMIAASQESAERSTDDYDGKLESLESASRFYLSRLSDFPAGIKNKIHKFNDMLLDATTSSTVDTNILSELRDESAAPSDEVEKSSGDEIYSGDNPRYSSTSSRSEKSKEEKSGGSALSLLDRLDWCNITHTASERPPASITTGRPPENQGNIGFKVDGSTGYVYPDSDCEVELPKLFLPESKEAAIHTFFYVYQGLGSGNIGGSFLSNKEYWLANQLLKFDVGRSRFRKIEEADPEPVTPDESEEEIDTEDIESILFEILDTIAEDSQEIILDAYELHIYKNLYYADIPGNINRLNSREIKNLAKRISAKQFEIKTDHIKALFEVYACTKGPIGREILDDWDPLGDSLQYCRFQGYTLDPIPSGRGRAMFL